MNFKSLFVDHELFQLYHIIFHMFYYPQTTYDIFYMEHISVKINKTNIYHSRTFLPNGMFFQPFYYFTREKILIEQ